MKLNQGDAKMKSQYFFEIKFYVGIYISYNNLSNYHLKFPFMINILKNKIFLLIFPT